MSDQPVELEDFPRSLRDPIVKQRRRAMLKLPHAAPLAAYVERLREKGGVEIPDFDPYDGGVEASVLFLFEKPGPMTAAMGKLSGSGFISRNNDDPTAEATYFFMQEAQISRKQAAIWNVVPWWNGTRKVTTHELREGSARVTELVQLLPKLKVAVLVGLKARQAEPYIKIAGLELITSDHPSPLVRARWPDRWKAIPLDWAKVRHFL